jgi:hypothetical protein
MRLFLAAAALGAIVLASVAAAAPGSAKSRMVATGGRVTALAADGDRAAFIVRATDPTSPTCAGVKVWEPLRARVVRLQRPCPGGAANNGEGTFGPALAGTRAAWLRTGGGNFVETNIMTATLARPKPTFVALGAVDHSGVGTFARSPVGGGGGLAFTLERRCDSDGDLNGRPEDQCPTGKKTGDIIAATIWRLAGRSSCPYRTFHHCSRVTKDDGELTVLAVEAGRIAVRTDGAVRLITASGRLLREFPVEARSAALSGERLAVRTAAAVAVYNTETGNLLDSFPAAKSLRLQDLERGILVTASSGTVTLRRLGTDNKTTLRPGGTAFAQLERPGLFVAAHRRLTFTPMRDVLRLLSG